METKRISLSEKKLMLKLLTYLGVETDNLTQKKIVKEFTDGELYCSFTQLPKSYGKTLLYNLIRFVEVKREYERNGMSVNFHLFV